MAGPGLRRPADHSRTGSAQPWTHGPGCAGVQALAAGLADMAGGAHSLLELRYVSRVERPHGLPRAQRQVRTVRGRRTEYKDALYTEFGVGVETDGAVAHPVRGPLAGPAPG